MRHGSTGFNNPSNPIIRAWADEPLSPEGRIEVQMTANKLKQYNPQYIYSSDFMRDTETAHLLANVLGISGKETDYDCRTWDVGDFTGKPESEVAEALNWFYAHPWETPPGSSESFDEFSSRWTKTLDAKLEFAANVDAQRPPIIVTHGRNLALTDSYLNGKSYTEGEMPYPAGYALIAVNNDRSLSFEIVGAQESVLLDV